MDLPAPRPHDVPVDTAAGPQRQLARVSTLLQWAWEDASVGEYDRAEGLVETAVNAATAVLEHIRALRTSAAGASGVAERIG